MADLTGPLAWRALEPFGAEIDFDFRTPLSPDAAAQLRALLYEKRLLVAHDQDLSLEQQQDLMANIGPVLRGARGMAEVSPKDGILNELPLAYHSDLAFAPEPFTAISLHAVDVEEDRTSTLFADSGLAAHTLPQALRARTENREALIVQPAGPDTRQIDVGGETSGARRVWPILIKHPATGEDLLWVNENQTDHVLGLDAEESRALLTELFAHLYSPAHVVQHHWRNGDLVIWDNYALQHGRPAISGVRRRRLQRASVAQRSLLEQMPEFFASRAVGRAATY
jgi:taurine dioxygenase